MFSLGPSIATLPRMPSALLCLHGYSQNAGLLRAHLQPLANRFPPATPLLCLDAPHECPPETAAHLGTRFGFEPGPPPWLRWWDASEDGSEYIGLDAALDSLRAALDRHPNAGVLGFSQGAILAASVAALAQRGDFPRPAFVVLVAGRVPRARALEEAFARPIQIPSLHVWGDRDQFALNESTKLVERFSPEQRETCVFPGAHVMPNRGPGAEAIAAFVSRWGEAG